MKQKTLKWLKEQAPCGWYGSTKQLRTCDKDDDVIECYTVADGLETQACCKIDIPTYEEILKDKNVDHFRYTCELDDDGAVIDEIVEPRFVAYGFVIFN